MTLINKGSVKDIYGTERIDEIEFEFTDRISVFDKPIPTLIPKKGKSICITATFWLKKAVEMGIPTHFIKQVSDVRTRVKRVNVIKDYDKINKHTKNYLIPVEFICRHYIAGSLYDRIKEGKIDYKKLGFKSMPEYGEKLHEPFFDLSTKVEKFDRIISEKEALSISGVDKNQLEEIFEYILRLDKELKKRVERGGLIHVDGKKEFAFDSDRNLMLVDVFGTADEDRFWDMEKYEEGECIELSKEFVRQIYRRNGYKDTLYQAREKGYLEPEIPPLSNEDIKEISNIYISLAQRIMGARD
jgi:phosphoribosylaminoimidazole-succinocarboxamide synthase